MASSSIYGLPASFSVGLVSIYGTRSLQGFTLPPDTNLTFGVIYQLDNSSLSQYSVGQNVLLPYKEAYSLIYGNQLYWLIDQSKIILVENPLT